MMQTAKLLWHKIKPIASVGTILLTVGLFIWFFANNPDAVQQLEQTSVLAIIVIVLLYFVMLFVLTAIYDICLRLCGSSIGFGENFLLTSYSTIINFFGPLQSGPGVRMVYLKKKHQVSMRSYAYASLLYYACFASISALFFLSGVISWWLTAVLGILIACTIFGGLKLYGRITKKPQLTVSPKLLIALFMGTLIQLLIVALIYAIELNTVQSGNVSIGQILTYTGTANFALFVSLTPGALGFREAFLLFTKELTALSSATILAASLLDRATYVIFLAVLFVMVIGFHGRKRFRSANHSSDNTL